MAGGTLVVHSGGVLRTREALRGLETPEATDTWKPVPHFELVSALIEGLIRHDITIIKEQYATSGKLDARFFGVLDLLIPGLAKPDYNLTLGIRGANDKSLAIQATAGVRVFVCDNLSFSGDSGTVVLKKKHTSRLDLAAVVPPAIDLYLEKAGMFTVDIDKMKEFSLTDARAKEIVYDAFVRERVMPLRYLPIVHKLYFDDPEQRAKFEDRSLWALNNSFTEAVKALNVLPQQRAGLTIGRHFSRTLHMSQGQDNRFTMDLGANVAPEEIERNGF